MVQNLSPSAQRVQSVLDDCNLSFEVIELPSSTRTAREAAQSIGCEVGSIAKSLLFTGCETGKALMVIASGSNRVDETLMEELAGEAVAMADAKTVRDITGFAIGGVPPVGLSQPVPVFIDRDLLQYERIWAAAGTPFSVFCLDPEHLEKITRGKVVRIRA